ncbi:GPN-loop GTPase 2 [Galdieria sulphuraria]|uniref:GPN-loop GTPase 2 n=1 Tax=Galdieria sulphuraria TaxID=130081 RepID=M2W8C2_GALSU|nr:nucleotide binding protein [Galdieria sulphuraria]EME32126.1 nucleotide binding protein [Galdieria sulphuraria]GJD09552.1 GPN-loop GTPase 2 [Galdieria sulphuraria]|eukprot:XP_005708646.1 nucleotide binding protein [Galdieria sulphuraria]
MPLYSQFVIGPPGSGKSTYCAAVRELLESNCRPVTLANFDPAAEFLPYSPDIDIRDLVNFKQLCSSDSCGPNGGLLRCFAVLEDNFSWLIESLSKTSNLYLIIDFPGQIELYLSCESIAKLIHRLQETFDLRAVVLNLIDSNRCLESSSFLSSCLTSLSLLINLSLPFLSVLTKIDIFRDAQDCEIDFEDICKCENLATHMTVLTGTSTFVALHSAICSLLEDFNLVQFEMLSVKDPQLLAKVVKEADHACGYMLR